MRTEVPVCTRCCFCLPLRYGLITWGYLRLALSIFFFIGLSTAFFRTLNFSLAINGHDYLSDLILLGVLILVMLTDIVLNTVFVVGGHMKNPKLLRTYYIYSSVLLVLTALLGLMSVIQTLIRVSRYHDIYFVGIAIMEVTAYLAQVLSQIYVLLLVRSEIMKLENNCEFRFVNIAAEAECNMNAKEAI